MSNTIITNYSNVSGNSNPDKSLVVIVNKDGSVSVDKDTINTLLEKQYENTNISIVRVNEDGKPDDASDHSSDETVPHINLTVDAFYAPIENKENDKGSQNEYITDLFTSDVSLIGFQNDHCYTPLTSPSQSRRGSTNNLSQLREESHVYPKADAKPPIPNSKKITILESKVITKGKTVQYFGPNSSGEILKGSDILKRPVSSPAIGASHVTPLIKKAEPIKSIIGSENIAIRQRALDKTDEAEDLDESTFEGDKSLLRKDVKKILSRKIELKNNGVLISELDQDRVKRIPKLCTKIEDKSKTTVFIKVDSSKQASSPSTAPKPEESDNLKNIKTDLKLDPFKNQKPMVKKEKKQPAHMTALYNDMSSLFTSPDVIRRVSTESRTSMKLAEPQNFTANSPFKIQQSATDKSATEAISSPKVSAVKVYSNTASSVTSDDSSNLLNHRIKDGINVTPDQLFPDSMLNSVPIQAPIGDIASIGMTSTSAANLASLAGPLSPSLDLLSGLQPEEEGLTEDLLRHVAQLVESSENLQEVIDKQVLGKVSDIPVKDKPPVMRQLESVSLPVQETERTFINTSVLKKEPIQIMRSNGRVITLPPIEAPATRASKRKSLLSASEQSPSVMSPESSKTPQPAKQPAKQPQKPPDLTKTMAQDKRDDDIESDESWNSEDDPDRLWCICKQPHNNRFMICCDMCEDWFHGKCVNVTKAMGQEMEEKGIEWRCPNCLKKKPLNTPAKMPQIRKSTEMKPDTKLLDDRMLKRSNLADNTNCIVCKKPARASSIYCSDDCILKHAQESLNITSPQTNPNMKNAKDGSMKPKPETRVIVYERKTGKLLAGPSAPTTSNLKMWLQEHPTYEVVRPNTTGNDRQLLSIKPRPKPLPSKVQTVLTLGQDRNVTIVQPSLKSPPIVKQQVKQIIQIPPQVKSPPITNKAQLLKQQPLKSPVTPKPPVQQAKTLIKSPPVQAYPKRDEFSMKKPSIEPIRENVRKALQEQMNLRMVESKDNKLSAEEIAKFVHDTEFELHDLFKDVGAKYKAKYRSLMFNLKDRKNLTLWQKICDRTITPKQLVRLSPEELASQELAQWRDKETKHQLELIKKSELDLLACNKTYVLKTHKGEEVMESRMMGTAELDPNVSVEDLMTELNKSVDVDENSAGSDSRSGSPITAPVPTSILNTQQSASHHKHSRHRSRSHDRDRSHKSSRTNKSSHSNRDDKSSRKHSTSRDRRSDSRSHHRRSSRDRSKSDRRDRSSKLHEDRRSSNSKLNSEGEKRSSSDKHTKEETSKSSKTKPVKDEAKTDSDKSDKSSSDKLSKGADSPYKPESEIKSPFSEFPPSPDIRFTQRLLSGAESDQEPTSTVDIGSAVWNGCINMIDVAKFNVTAHDMSGISEDVMFELDTDLDIVGRISADTVWDYISKMKKQGSKDMLLLRFNPISADDKTQYMALYNYLENRSRLGVIKVGNGGGIKDFYILPLPAAAPLNPVLLPMRGPGFGDSKTDMLIAIIVKQRRKRHAHGSSHGLPPKVARIVTNPTEGSYTPPRSPKRKAASNLTGMPLPSYKPNLPSAVVEKIAASLACADDDDEPYSPGGSDSQTPERSNSPARYESTQPAKSSELKKKMEELTRKIEEEKKQIQNMTVKIPGDALDEPYSPSRPMSPPSQEPNLSILSNIFIPSNLQEILANVKKNSSTPAETREYVPSAITAAPLAAPLTAPLAAPFINETHDVDMRILNAPPFSTPPPTITKSASKLSTLSEAELLSMVPDEELLNSPTTTATKFPPLAVPPLPTDVSVPPPPYVKPRMDFIQPPPPGLDENM